jgi:hypothetical protein
VHTYNVDAGPTNNINTVPSTSTTSAGSQTVLGRRMMTVCMIPPDHRLNLTNVVVAAVSGLSDFQAQARTKALM